MGKVGKNLEAIVEMWVYCKTNRKSLEDPSGELLLFYLHFNTPFCLRIRNGMENQKVTRKNGTIEIISLRDDTIWNKIVLVEMERH